ncbi:flavodoxin [Clostridium sp. MCC353]|uniref:flavodoxin n=1 Tax=Clostridium sp. MCC353 TaxID=2592646 RepID=UPI001C019870|nr:flavodoxin [Clostridium sp. MCC353]MBT9774971.1 flavodoxin [Clostridium sp. MCC353]
MKEVYVVYWSGTGNTAAMAEAVGEGIEAGGAAAKVVSVGEVSPEVLKEAECFALGCPSMGAEQLEEGEMEPFVSGVEGFASGKKIGLFGSYGWGDGEWMREWASRMEGAGAQIAGGEGVIANEAPDEEALDALRKLGMELAQ